MQNKEYMADCISISLLEMTPINKSVAYLCGSSSRHYIVDLNTLSCNCWEFDEYRAKHKYNNVSRYCRHLLQAIKFFSPEQISIENIQPKNEYVATALNDYLINGLTFPSRMEAYFPVVEGNRYLIIQDVNTGWFNVYTREQAHRNEIICTGEILKHGYNPRNNRWGWGDGPFNPLPIKSYIRQLYRPESIKIEKNEGEYNKILEEFIKIPVDVPVMLDNLSSIDSYLYNETSVSVIINTLKRLRNVVNVDRETAKKIFEKYKGYLPKVLDQVNADISGKIVKSLADLENEKSLDIFKKAADFIDIEEEKKLYDSVGSCTLKDTAEYKLSLTPPEWYSHAKGHRFWGKTYSDFVFRSFNSKEKIDSDQCAIIDYFSSLIIIDGTTLSTFSVAEICKCKAIYCNDPRKL